MKTYEAYVPVDLKITLEATDEVVAGDRASFAVDWFVKGASPYKLNIPGVGAFSLELAPLEEDDDDTPEVFEVDRVETIGRLGVIQHDPWAEPVEGACLIPADHPSQHYGADGKLGGVLRGDEWGASAAPLSHEAASAAINSDGDY